MSYAFVSVFTITVLLNVFYFDPVETLEDIDVYPTCEECIKSPCHKMGNNCAPTTNKEFVCFHCARKTLDEDQQFYSEKSCKNACSDPSKCTCDGPCWVCVLKGNSPSMRCDNLGYVLNDNCQEVPYNPQ
jgi:hypothetical protein